jgi:predicted NAD/FAD-dependent oxidoreductase
VTENTARTALPRTGKLVGCSQCEVAVIGAGPYGLPAGTHVKAKGIRVRVFWRTDGVLGQEDARRHAAAVVILGGIEFV